MSKEERRSYERMIDNQRVLESTFDTERMEGRAEGLQEGIEKGIEKGRAEGLKEGIEKVAVSMYNLKIPLPQIIEATGLTEKQILEIVK
jgi:predicted transposase/invertase (TIGR01784 family)